MEDPSAQNNCGVQDKSLETPGIWVLLVAVLPTAHAGASKAPRLYGCLLSVLPLSRRGLHESAMERYFPCQ